MCGGWSEEHVPRVCPQNSRETGHAETILAPHAAPATRWTGALWAGWRNGALWAGRRNNALC